MSSWRDNLRRIEPYVPGEQPNLPDMIKLNTNENPYPPSPKVERALKSFDAAELKLYPEPDSHTLVCELAKRNGMREDEVYVGVGSDDVLAIAFMAFFNSSKPILFPDITYSFYDVWAELFRIPYERPKLDGNFELNTSDYYGENGGIVIANPNAPTGIALTEPALRDIVEHNRDVIVIIDEAYADFSGNSALLLTKDYDNVIITQTFSKSRSLAGMRIGFAMGNAELIRAMNDVRFSFNSYPLSRVAVSVGLASLGDEEYFKKTVSQIIETREWTKNEFKRLGFHFGDSQTNFIFAEHESVSAAEIFSKLKDKHIFVRHFSSPRIDNYLRVTIGTRDEMKVLVSELENILN